MPALQDPLAGVRRGWGGRMGLGHDGIRSVKFVRTLGLGSNGAVTNYDYYVDFLGQGVMQ